MGGKGSKPDKHAHKPAYSQGVGPTTAAGQAAAGGGGGAGAAPVGLARSQTAAFQKKYGFIPDNFSSVQQVQEKLREVGLESSNLIVGVDFTKSNEWTGRQSFGGRCLHQIGPETNPYEMAIVSVGQCLAAFDEDNLIPCFGFGDVTTHDKAVFSFYPDSRPCQGFDDALARYRAITPYVKLSGPTSFAPIIEAGVRTVEQSGGQYHVLLIIADGQVTRSVDLPDTELSDQEKATVEAIGAASNYPMSIILVGVGDGPWDTMKAFDDVLPQRNFDNFQFVNLTQIMTYGQGSAEQRAAHFALMSLMEIPFQFKACNELGLVGRRAGRMPPLEPLPPPPGVLEMDARAMAFVQQQQQQQAQYQQQSSQPGSFHDSSFGSSVAGVAESRECPVCLQFPKDTAFQCGHQVCQVCASKVVDCPVCRTPVAVRIKLYA